MNLNNAKYISIIVEEGTVSKAAEKLFISQPAISQTIKQVEEELGLKIFEKDGRKLKLTSAGKVYLNTSQQIMMLYKNMQKELSYLKPDKKFNINFGISTEYGTIILPKIINDIRENRPNINLNITLMGSTDLEKAVSEGKVDVAICSNVSSYANIEYIFLSQDLIGVLTGEKSDLYSTFINAQPISLNDTLSSDFVTLTPGNYSRFVLDFLLNKNNLTVKKLLEVSSFDIAKNIAIYCGEVLITSYALVKKEVENSNIKAKFFPLKDISLEKKLYLIKNKEKYLNDNMIYFMDLVKSLSNYMLDISTNDI